MTNNACNIKVSNRQKQGLNNNLTFHGKAAGTCGEIDRRSVRWPLPLILSAIRRRSFWEEGFEKFGDENTYDDQRAAHNAGDTQNFAEG